MDKDITKLKELIENSDRIFITSHVSPDPDSICSTLLLGTTLEENYPDKKIYLHSEDRPDDLEYLSGFERLNFMPLDKALESQTPELIIIVDAMNLARCTRGNWQLLTTEVETRKIPVAIIDHHEPVGVMNNEVYINQGFPAAVQEVYTTCFDELQFKKPQGWAQTTITGLYSDTGGFTYLNSTYRKTLGLIATLLDAGVKIEEVKNRLHQYTEAQLQVLSELSANSSHFDNYSYSYLTDAFVQKWTAEKKSPSELHAGVAIFTNSFIRNVEGRSWGFVVYRDPRLEDGVYSVSLRSMSGNVDVSLVAGRMDGGGHKGAAGAKVQASNIEEAIAIVKSHISQ